ncbi:endo-1,4-beta-xylanase [Silvibacterium bohemicum]|uniref:Beta-xylanase n=1 Tax=Silvibacterium bohemicum TaxID=1577686 RepID=A0A841JTS7_9BACT|nr:endo-1,4-beta-xylanase [Silvibacterium bohemicum]MBB6142371.1 endo-1,4-beta-xylanase [Silvibacterium bohemicum]
MQNRREFLRLLSAAAVLPPLTNAYQEKDTRPSALADVSGPRSLRAHAEQRGLLVGCAVVPDRLTGEPPYGSVVAEQANLLVAENAMKWGALRPAPGKFDFRGADEILAFAAGHKQKVRGHNLCWHESIPKWFDGAVTRDNARQFLVQHIQTVAGRYAGKLHSWDVVNEAIDTKSDRPDALRKSPWLELIGPDYIELAFRTARQADPAALLTYNDYGIENDSADNREKRGQVLQLVRRMKDRGVPIDAVGVQSHLTVTDPAPGAGLQEFVRELRRMGLQVFVTELDINERKLEGSIAERDAAIAKLYKDYVTMMVAEPNVSAVLTWGITDRYTWLDGPKYARIDGKPQRCLPFDSDYQPSPAFFAYRDALDTRLPSASVPTHK